MMAAFDLQVQFTDITCCHKNCGMTFAVPDSWRKNRLKDHVWFYCPNGHSQHYGGETNEQKLRKQIKHIEAENEKCMLNLQRKNQDLVLLRMADKEELFVRDDGKIIHIKKSNGASEISFLCGYEDSLSLFNKITSIYEEQRLCVRCSKAMEIKNREVE